MRSRTNDPSDSMSSQTSRTAEAISDAPAGSAGYDLPAPNTARARESAAATKTMETIPETRAGRLRRNARQWRLHGYAVAIVVLIAVLIALAATNTARVHVDWLVGSSRISLVWLVLVAAIIGWILGVLASVRFQWMTRAPHRRR